MLALTSTVAADAAASGAQVLETIPQFRFLFWAYVLIFVIILVFLVTIALRQRTLTREIEALERRIQDRR